MAAPTVSVTLNRTTGVAPLDVFLDASATTQDGGAERPFHQIGFRIDWGDPDSSRPVASGGPLAAHVFDAPGVYLVTVRAVGLGFEEASESVWVTVSDPAVVFAGTNTVCVSQSGDFTGAPAGALQVTESSWNTAMLAHYGDGKQVLFRRGDTFLANGTPVLDPAVTAKVGAFGTGTMPDALGRFGNDPILDLSTNNTSFIDVAPTAGARAIIEHINVVPRAGVTVWRAFSANAQMQNFLIHRCRVPEANYVTSALPASGGTLLHEDVTVSHCEFVDYNTYGIFGSFRRFALLGCKFHGVDPITEHHVRLPLVLDAVIEGNYFGDNIGLTKTALKINGSLDSTGEVASDRVVVRANTFEVPCQWPISLSPQNSGVATAEEVRNVILEGNRLNPVQGCTTFVQHSAVGVTVRNNVVNNTATDTWGSLVNIQRWSAVQPQDTEIYHNTTWSVLNPFGQILVGGSSDVAGDPHGGTVIAYNNSLNSQAATPEVNGGGVDVDDQGNLINAAMAFTSAGTGDFTIGVGSAAIGAGVLGAQSYFDAANLQRSTQDVGAYLYPETNPQPEDLTDAPGVPGALTRARTLTWTDDAEPAFIVGRIAAGTRVFRGMALELAASGLLEPLVGTGTFYGFAEQDVDNRTGSAPADVMVRVSGTIVLATSSNVLQAAMFAAVVDATDDGSFWLDYAGGVAGSPIGRPIRIVSTGVGGKFVCYFQGVGVRS